MYCVNQNMYDQWIGTCVIQDGTEKARHDTKEKAVEWVIDCAKGMNHVDITIDDIIVSYYIKDSSELFAEIYEDALEEIKDLKKPKGFSAEHFQQARAKTTDMLIDALDKVNIVNLRLRIALKEIARHPHPSDCPAYGHDTSACRCAIQLAKDALDNIKG